MFMIMSSCVMIVGTCNLTPAAVDGSDAYYQLMLLHNCSSQCERGTSLQYREVRPFDRGGDLGIDTSCTQYLSCCLAQALLWQGSVLGRETYIRVLGNETDQICGDP